MNMYAMKLIFLGNLITGSVLFKGGTEAFQPQKWPEKKKLGAKKKIKVFEEGVGGEINILI